MQKANPKSTVAPEVPLLNLGWFVVYSGVPQMQGTSSWLWGFNLLLLRLLGEISLSLLCSQLLGFSFGFGPTSACRSPEGICSCPDRTGLKEQLIRGLWLTQAGGREEYRVWGEPAAAEASVTLHQPEAPCVLLGQLSLDHGTLAVAGCTGSREGRCG